MESATVPTTGIFPSRSPKESRRPVFGRAICQIWAVPYNFGARRQRAHVPEAETGAAKVAGMTASARVKKRMAIGVCDKSKESKELCPVGYQ